jgi:tellurite resistance-related uncharacterized protein
MVAPYRTTTVFCQDTLPDALRREHRTKAGVWGVVRVLEGRLRLDYGDGSHTRLLDPDTPGVLQPEQPHFVTPLGRMRMQVEFYDREPDINSEAKELAGPHSDQLS